MVETIQRKVIILCAHGDRRGVDRNANLLRLEADVRDFFSQDIVTSVLLSQEGELEKTLDQYADRQIVMVPLLFSDGYFYQKILRQAQQLPGEIVILPPLSEWKELVDYVLRISDQTKPFLVIAHGSKRTSASRKACESFALSIRQKSDLDVSCAFLEETPFALDAVDDVNEPLTVLGLFLGHGLHGGEDWQEIQSALKGTGSEISIVGDLSELGEILIKKLTATF